MACSVVETFGEAGKARDLDEVLRLEYRSKLLNPKWAKVRPQQLLFCLVLLAWQGARPGQGAAPGVRSTAASHVVQGAARRLLAG